MKQELTDIPKTREEAERQKGPISFTILLMVFGIIAVFILFFGPVFLEFFN